MAILLGGNRFAEVPFVSKHFVQLSAGGELKNDVDPRLIVKEPIHTQNVLVSAQLKRNVNIIRWYTLPNSLGIPQMGLDLDLSTQLVLHAGLHQLRLLDDFDGNDELALSLPCKVYVPKLPPPEWSAYLEVFQRPLLGPAQQGSGRSCR